MPDDDDFVKTIEKMADESAAKAEAPKRERKRTTRAMPRKPLQPRLESFFTGIAMLTYSRDQVCGAALAEHAPKMAEAYSNWADQSPRVRAMLERLLSGGAGGEALMSMVPVVVVVLAHHNLLPGFANQFGPKPEVTNVDNGKVGQTDDGPTAVS